MQLLASIVSPGNHPAEGKRYRRDKTPSEGNGTREISSSEGTLTPA
jgi:hypothetical protein